MKKMLTAMMILFILFSNGLAKKAFADTSDLLTELKDLGNNTYKIMLNVVTDITEDGEFYIDIQNGIEYIKDSFLINGKPVDVSIEEIGNFLRLHIKSTFNPETKAEYKINTSSIKANKTYLVHNSIRTKGNQTSIGGWKTFKFRIPSILEESKPNGNTNIAPELG